MSKYRFQRMLLIKPAKRHTVLAWLTWAVRIIVGGLFVFSSITKGLDIWGTVYKFDDYQHALGMDSWGAANVVGVFALCLAEFLTGVFLLLGCYRRWAPVYAALIMAFMLPLTYWVMTKNPIADCGCFGDAYVISNTETFWKNVILTVLIIWLLIYNRKTSWAITPALQFLAVILSGAYFLAIAVIGFMYQPLVDFRAYPEGEIFLEPNETDDNQEDQDYVFVYEKDGKQQEFRIDDELPDEDDGWTFIEKKEAPAAGAEAAAEEKRPEKREKNIRIYDKEGLNDETETLTATGKLMLLMIPDIAEVAGANTVKIDSLQSYCKKAGVEMIAVVGGSQKEIALWEDIALPTYPVYTAEDTSIKEVVRGNPGVVYVDNNVVEWKSTLWALNEADLSTKDEIKQPMELRHNGLPQLKELSYIYIALMAALVLLSVFTKTFGLFRFRSRSHIDELQIGAEPAINGVAARVEVEGSDPAEEGDSQETPDENKDEPAETADNQETPDEKKDEEE